MGSGGTSTRAPYVDGTTGNQSTVVGSARIGAIAFEVDGTIDPETITNAVMSVYVNSINGNLGSNWMLLAAYETENPQLTYSVGGMDDTLYPAVNNDYSYDAALWSNERCSTSSKGWKTLDVKRAVVNALTADGGKSEKVTVVLRIQVPAAGLNISVSGSEAPYLTVTTGAKITGTVKIVDTDGNELLPSESFVSGEGKYIYDKKIEEKLELDGEYYMYNSLASVTEITLSEEGENVIMLVYSKFNEDDFYSGHTLIERGATCWFADPRSVKFEHDDIYDDEGNLVLPKSSKTIVGAIDTSGTVKAVQYDNLTGVTDEITIDTGFQADDHNNPTFLELPDHRIMVFWSQHTAEEYWYYRVTNEPDDLKTLGTEHKVSVAGCGNYTYPSPFYLSDAPDSFFLCWRGVSWHPTIAKYSLPDENGEIKCEIAPTQMVQTIGARPYVKYGSNGKDRIYFAFTTAHPDNNNPNWIYYSEIDINTLNLYNVENELLCEGENLPYGKDNKINTSSDYGSFTVDSPSNNRDWVWDIAKDEEGNPVIAFTRISSGKTQHDYYYGKWNPETKTWDKTYIADGGGRFHQGTGEMCYSGGLCLDHSNPSIVYISKPTAGFYGDVYEIWKLEMDGVTVKSETQITRNSQYNNVRPFVAVGSDSDDKISLTWMNGLYYYWIVSDSLPDAFPTSIMTMSEIDSVNVTVNVTYVTSDATVIGSGNVEYNTENGKIPAGNVFIEGKGNYTYAETAVTEDTRITVTPITIFTWNTTTNNFFYTDKALTGNGTNRAGYMCVDVPAEVQATVLSLNATLNNGGKNAPSLTFYAVPAESLENIDLTKGAETTAELDDIFGEETKVVGGVNVKLIDGSSDTNGSSVTVSFTAPVDLTDYAGKEIALKMVADNGTGIITVNSASVEALGLGSELGFVPDDTAGFETNALTLNFLFGGALGKINGVTYKASISAGETAVGDIEVSSEKSTIALIPADDSADGYGSNVNYTATLKAIIGESEFAVGKTTSSLYKAVVEDIANSSYTKEQLSSDRLANANKVIANGGLVSIAELDDTRSKIMETVEDETAIRIKTEFSELGIGFLCKGGKLYVGSASADGDDTTVYTKISLDRDTVTLSTGEGETQETVSFALDAVELEFIEEMLLEEEINSDLTIDFDFTEIM
ncbi:MAG: BNR-4 repeat-containing protein [Clostridia bacterium]